MTYKVIGYMSLSLFIRSCGLTARKRDVARPRSRSCLLHTLAGASSILRYWHLLLLSFGLCMVYIGRVVPFSQVPLMAAYLGMDFTRRKCFFQSSLRVPFETYWRER